MGSLWRQYHQPVSLAEALLALSAPGPACPIAGGTDLILDLRQGHRPPVHTLVDVSGIPELTALDLRGSETSRQIALRRLIERLAEDGAGRLIQVF